MSSNHIVLYSHGFGVQKDDRGLFTDIANSIEDTEHVMFDYNEFDAPSNTLTVAPLHSQAKILKAQYDNLRRQNPDAIIDLVCHSQGCVVAGLASLDGIRKTILLAPPTRFLGSEEKIKQMSERDGTIIEDGVVSYPRRDGSTTIIKQDYWQSRDKISDPVGLFNELVEKSDVTIVKALQDEVLGETKYSTLSTKATLIEQEANHDFTDKSRPVLTKLVNGILLA